MMFALAACLSGGLGGCTHGPAASGDVDLVWGRPGRADGRLQKPRAMAIDSQNRLYVVDMTARIQVFDADGRFLRGWRTPAADNGKPSGLSLGRDGTLLVADTHYFRMLRYTLDGTLLPARTIGGRQGHGDGEFEFVTDAVEDSAGNVYIAQYGEHDRIQKFSAQGQWLLAWGSHGSRPGQFARPQNLAIDRDDRIWVADACNHRIQVFSGDGRLLFGWGRQGSKPGTLRYPYDLAFGPDGALYVCEFGNHRVQKFTLQGRSLGCWGAPGRGPGQLYNPWALVCDTQGRIHVLDTNNHRIQRVKL